MMPFMSNRGELDRLRAQIDKTDCELIAALAARLEYVRRIGAYKKQNNIGVRDEKRRYEVLSSRAALGKKRGVPEDLVREIFEKILDHAEAIEKK